MRRVLAALAVILLTLAAAAPLGASGPRYGDFGNLRFGDCQYASGANLVLSRWPGAHITTAEVLRAWRTAPNDPTGGLTYLEDYGFAGHRAASATVVTGTSAIIAGADAGGIYAALSWGHVVAVTHASANEVTVVDAGLVTHNTWAEFRRFYDAPDSFLYAITWAAPNTQQITFEGSYETSTMTTQVEPTGTVAPIEALGMVNAGYTFEGWATTQDGTVAQYQSGQPFDFTHSMTLYALWTYTGG